MSTSLFTKLERAADPTNNERHTWKSEDTASAVIRHIKQMLTTRHGSSITVPDYGVPDVTHLLHDMTEAIAVIQRSVKTSIQMYEPRLKNVQIRHVRNTNEVGQPAMMFEISGHLVLADGRRQPLRIGTTMDEHGNVEIQEL
ncbi:MAG: type VI secretion system baseplate subunit TssE [Polyangiaceae bacterium]|nr:type VI secretion system baseplate subunit TssE [Polyangiaceae bacterium]